MKLLLTTIAAVLVVGCGESQSTAKAPDISIHDAVKKRNITGFKQHLADGVDVNAGNVFGTTLCIMRLNMAARKLSNC